jgi:uncharacterized protein
MNKNPIKLIATILLIVGGLNWGLVGLLNFDLVAALFGQMSLISRVVYTLVGASAVYLALALATDTDR